MTFYETLTAAVADMTRHGFDSAERLEAWLDRIRAAARASLVPPAQLERHLQDTLKAIYTRMVGRGGVFRYNPGVSRFTLEHIKPKLRAELDRRIMASANLIKLNREKAIQSTLQRFSGWATSIPAGGSDVQDKPEVKSDVSKSLKQLPFEERRVAIDQGHKLISAINDIVAQDGGAIAAVWHSNWRQQNYNYREDHRERDRKVYLIRDSWAHKAGLVKPGKVGYTDEITQPAEEPMCRCFYLFVYSLEDLPADMLTEKGREEIARVREATAA